MSTTVDIHSTANIWSIPGDSQDVLLSPMKGPNTIEQEVETDEDDDISTPVTDSTWQNHHAQTGVSESLHEQWDIDLSKPYPFVPSTAEHTRLEEQSACFNEIMLGNFTRAPLQRPKRILDLGCGTGKQTVLLAKKYPEAIVIGIDFSPVPDIHPRPRNVLYIHGNFTELAGKHEALSDNSFDLVFERMLMMNIHDWPAHFTQIKSLLKPGGWVECQEWHPFNPYNCQEELVSDAWHFNKVIFNGPTAQGLDMDVAIHLEDYLQSSGFGYVVAETFPIAIRPGWKERPETDNMGRYIQATLTRLAKALLEQAAKCNTEMLAQMWNECEGKYFGGELGLHDKFYAIIGRKQ